VIATASAMPRDDFVGLPRPEARDDIYLIIAKSQGASVRF